jgi:hypothetical protein
MTPEQLIDRYCLAWSADDPAEREQHLRAVWADGATYTDPRVHATTIDELLAHISRIHAGRPGARVLRTSRVDLHHNLARFHWHVALPDGTSLPDGIDFAELDATGSRITRIVGFFGPLRDPGSPAP